MSGTLQTAVCVLHNISRATLPPYAYHFLAFGIPVCVCEWVCSCCYQQVKTRCCIVLNWQLAQLVRVPTKGKVMIAGMNRAISWRAATFPSFVFHLFLFRSSKDLQLKRWLATRDRNCLRLCQVGKNKASESCGSRRFCRSSGDKTLVTPLACRFIHVFFFDVLMGCIGELTERTQKNAGIVMINDIQYLINHSDKTELMGCGVQKGKSRQEHMSRQFKTWFIAGYHVSV